MKSILSLLTVGIIPFAFLVSSEIAPAQETKTTKKVSPIGNWSWLRKSGDKQIESKITVIKKEGKFFGKLTDDEQELELKNAKLEDGQFSFAVTPHKESPDKQIKFKGKLSADQIKGKMSYTINGDIKTKDWVAKRVQSFDAITGKWNLEFETPDGNQLEFEIEVKKKNNRGISLRFTNQDSTEISNIKFKNDILTFESKQQYEGEPLKVEWDLKLDGEALDGALYYQFERIPDNRGDIDVFGHRVK